MKVGDMVPDRPESVGDVRAFANARVPKEGRVVYIHPEGRFYTLFFEVGDKGQGYNETRYFTPAEIEEGRRTGIFRLPSNMLTGGRANGNAPLGFQRIGDFEEYDRPRSSRMMSTNLDDIDIEM